MARTTRNTRAVTFERTNLDDVLGSVESASVAARKIEVKARRAQTFTITIDREVIQQQEMWLKHAIKMAGIKPDNADTQADYLKHVEKQTVAGKDISSYTEFRVNFGAKAAWKIAVIDGDVALAELELQTAQENLQKFYEALKAAK
jgi:hypothetical protein